MLAYLRSDADRLNQAAREFRREAGGAVLGRVRELGLDRT
jgi:hypothetical protein